MSQSRKQPVGLPVILSAILCGGMFGAALFCNTQLLLQLDPTNVTVITQSFSARHALPCILYVIVCAGLLLSGLIHLKRRQPELTSRQLALAPLPLLFCLAALFAIGWFSTIWMTLCAGLATFRLLLLMKANVDWWADKRLFRKLTTVNVIFGILVVAASFYMQRQTMTTLYNFGLEWWTLVDVARNTAEGSWFMTSETGQNFLGSHFMPLTILLLIPFSSLFSTPDMLFFINALLIYSCAPLVYIMARERNLPRSWAAGLALIVLLSPGLANMGTESNYGIYTNYLFIPLLLLFFILLEKKCFKRAFLLFVISLFLNEGLALVWVGIGVVAFIRGWKKAGAWLSVISLAYFLLVALWVMPYFANMPTDPSPELISLPDGSVILSPLLRQEELWRGITDSENLLAAILLLLPVFYLTLSRPLLLSALLLPFAIIMLRKESTMAMSMRNQASFLMIVYINAIFALDMLRHVPRPGRWIRTLSLGLGSAGKEQTAAALLGSSLVCSVLAFYFFAHGLHGKNMFEPRRNATLTQPFRELKNLIPPEVPINSGIALTGHFALRNRVYPNYSGLHYISEYVLLDLFSQWENQERMDQVRGFLRQQEYEVIYRYVKDGHFFILLHRNATNDITPDNIVTMPYEDFRKIGQLVPQKQADCEVRYIRTPDRILFFIRPVGLLDHDLEIRTLLFNDSGDSSGSRNLFGNGVTPVFIAPMNAVMVLSEPIPPYWNNVTDIKVKLIPRSAIDFDHMRFPIKQQR